MKHDTNITMSMTIINQQIQSSKLRVTPCVTGHGTPFRLALQSSHMKCPDTRERADCYHKSQGSNRHYTAVNVISTFVILSD